METARANQEAIIIGLVYLPSCSMKVYTPEISPIYSLQDNKKAPDNKSDAFLVELQGTAPWSAGLSLVNLLQV